MTEIAGSANYSYSTLTPLSEWSPKWPCPVSGLQSSFTVYRSAAGQRL